MKKLKYKSARWIATDALCKFLGNAGNGFPDNVRAISSKPLSGSICAPGNYRQ